MISLLVMIVAPIVLITLFRVLTSDDDDGLDQEFYED